MELFHPYLKAALKNYADIQVGVVISLVGVVNTNNKIIVELRIVMVTINYHNEFNDVIIIINNSLFCL